jgi:hypothetical protein
VLDRIGIHYRPNKTGFECVHAPSIDLSSVQPVEGSGQTGGGPKRPSIASAGEEGFDAWAFGENGSAGSALLVRFEISIVKVSWSLARAIVVVKRMSC